MISTARRVLVKVNELGLGGTQLNAVDFAAAARRRGIESVIVGYGESLPATGDSILDVARERGVEVQVLQQGPRGGARDRRRRARELADLADALRVDLVHAYGAWSARQAYWGPCRFGRRPLVMTVYEMYVPDTVYRRPELIVGTGYLLDEQREQRGHTHLISPPVDLEWDRPGVASTGDLATRLANLDGVVVGIVSRLDQSMKAHGVGVAIEAMERLGSERVHLVIAGDGDSAERLRAQGDAVNAALGREVVHFLGPLVDPRPVYDGADIVLGMGGSAARALGFGRPLVVVGERGWCCTFRPESAGALYRQSFWSDERVNDGTSLLVDALRPLVGDEAERQRLGTFGRQFAERNFGLEAMTDRLVDVYEAALGYGPREWFADLSTEARNGALAVRWKTRDLLSRGART